jgi:exodeoxyribonuclease V alpha subunit
VLDFEERANRRLVGAPLSPFGTAQLRLGDLSSSPFDPSPAIIDVDPHDAFIAGEVAGWATELSSAERPALSALIARLLTEVGQGSTRLALTDADRALVARVPALVGSPGANTPFIAVDGHLTTHRLFAAEARLATALDDRFAPAPPQFATDDVATALATVTKTAVPSPSAEQQQAVARALAGRLGIITGGPGTGKTTIVLALVRTLVRLGVKATDIALAAPTGKAANRLGEALRDGLSRLNGADPLDAALIASPPASETLHRLLRHSPSARSFAHGEGAPLPHQVVIVDESSMIDLSLMDRLFAALAPTTQITLLGDADQLPSVEAGTVFRDVAARGVRLHESHRMDPSRPEGRRILTLAAAIHDGQRDFSGLIDQRPDAAAITFTGVEICPAVARNAFITRWFNERIRPSAAYTEIARTSFVLQRHPDAGPAHRFDPEAIALFDRAFAEQQSRRLLAVTRGRPTGVDALNATLHARWGARSTQAVAGEPMMMLRNDYQRGLWNGDQGLVINLRDGGVRTAVVFKIAGIWTPFPLESLRDSLGLAFALTVHKAQGSEYDEVALVLPETSSPLLTRDLLYTALTRSRRGVVICGDLMLLAAGAANAPTRLSGFSAPF